MAAAIIKCGGHDVSVIIVRNGHGDLFGLAEIFFILLPQYPG